MENSGRASIDLACFRRTTRPARTLDLEIAATDGEGSAPGPPGRGVLSHLGHALSSRGVV